MTPKGKLIPIGGSEIRSKQAFSSEEMQLAENKLDVLARVVAEIKGKETRIEVLPTASSVPHLVSQDYLNSFQNLGCASVGVMNIRNKKQALLPEYLERIREADALMFSGGNQFKITRAFLGTEMYDLILDRYWNDPTFVIAGTSAGAMMMSDTMIYEGTSKEAMRTGKAKTTQGMNFLPNSVIDSHFVQRNRYGRLMVAVANHPEQIGIGISENTGIILKEGRYIECIGSSQVCIFDGEKLQLPEFGDYNEERLMTFSNMVTHILVEGNRFDLATRKMIASH